MNVLSLFDGMSCGQIALERAGIHVDNYYSSEIDKYAIQITQKNYPSTIQLGDVTKWRDWELPHIDLILAGSPCQGFSFAGRQLAFDDSRSKLFFVFAEILKSARRVNLDLNFLLENVKMKQKYQDVISDILGLFPVKLNSSLLSAQNRERLYWFNFLSTPLRDKGVLLKDIIESGIVDRDKSYCLDANYWKGGNLKSYYEKHRRQLVFEPVNFTERRTPEAKRIRREHMLKYGKDWSPRRAKELVPREDGKVNCLTTSLTKEHIILDEGLCFRMLTPIECERLQTVPDNYTEGVSNTQRYKMLGNGWTIDVIVHILKGIARKRIQEAKDSMGLFNR